MYIDNKTIIGCVSGTIYQMHPYHKPENIDKIIEKLLEYFKNYNKNTNDTFVLLEFNNYDDFYKWLKEFLLNIKEFRQLNISKKLKDAGVDDVDDERNSGIKFVDRYTVETYDSRYDDFVDLDACIRNIYNNIIDKKENDEDCFLCKYAESYGSLNPGSEICKNCICNPIMKFNREPHPMSIKPHNEWTDEEKEKYKLD